MDLLNETLFLYILPSPFLLTTPHWSSYSFSNSTLLRVSLARHIYSGILCWCLLFLAYMIIPIIYPSHSVSYPLLFLPENMEQKEISYLNKLTKKIALQIVKLLFHSWHLDKKRFFLKMNHKSHSLQSIQERNVLFIRVILFIRRIWFFCL